jgi:hypothetical protein
MADDMQSLARKLIGPLWPWIADRIPIQVGAFTPTLVGVTIAGTFTYDATETFCNWTRLGNRVLFNGRVRITAIAVAPTGNLTIAGFPFVAATLATGTQPSGGANFIVWVLTLPAGYTQVGASFIEGETAVRLLRSGTGVAAAGVQGGELVLVGGAAEFRFEGQYQI